MVCSHHVSKGNALAALELCDNDIASAVNLEEAREKIQRVLPFAHTDLIRTNLMDFTVPAAGASVAAGLNVDDTFTLVFSEQVLQQAFKKTTDDMAAWIFSPDTEEVQVYGLRGCMETTTTVGGATLPMTWEPMATTESHKEIALHKTSQEYKTIARRFAETGTSGGVFQIVSICRLQQKYTWLQYELRKTQMNERCDGIGANERLLWHGAPFETVPKIIQNGFNRTFVSTAAFGNGIYFARDASYSQNRRYSTPDRDGVQRLFLTRVLVGCAEVGKRGMKTPNERDGGGGELFDCLVNDPDNPHSHYPAGHSHAGESTALRDSSAKRSQIFVSCHHDSQAYPEYVVAFKLDPTCAGGGAFAAGASAGSGRIHHPGSGRGGSRQSVSFMPTFSAGRGGGLRVPRPHVPRQLVAQPVSTFHDGRGGGRGRGGGGARGGRRGDGRGGGRGGDDPQRLIRTSAQLDRVNADYHAFCSMQPQLPWLRLNKSSDLIYDCSIDVEPDSASTSTTPGVSTACTIDLRIDFTGTSYPFAQPMVTVVTAGFAHPSVAADNTFTVALAQGWNPTIGCFPPGYHSNHTLVGLFLEATGLKNQHADAQV
jgi:hypothetical protein